MMLANWAGRKMTRGSSMESAFKCGSKIKLSQKYFKSNPFIFSLNMAYNLKKKTSKRKFIPWNIFLHPLAPRQFRIVIVFLTFDCFFAGMQPTEQALYFFILNTCMKFYSEKHFKFMLYDNLKYRKLFKTVNCLPFFGYSLYF